MAPLPPLYAIVDVEAGGRVRWDPRDLARAVLDGGARLLQLRAKRLAGGALYELAAAVQELASEAGARLVINDRADIAALAGAAGVHVGQDDLAVSDVRRIVGPAALVGLSTHRDAEVAAAAGEPISYVAVGPVFATTTKATGCEPVGLELVRRAATLLAPRGIPVVAIGGITLERAPALVDAGAAAVAVVGDLLAGGDPAARVRAYLSALA